MVINCDLCDKHIVKYAMDLGDTVCLEISKDKIKYICDDCAEKIAMQLIRR